MDATSEDLEAITGLTVATGITTSSPVAFATSGKSSSSNGPRNNSSFRIPIRLMALASPQSSSEMIRIVHDALFQLHL
jgi:hypothetical protein